MKRLVPLLAALTALSACSGYDDDQPVEAVSQSEAEALDDAAEMIEQRRLPDDAVPAAGDGTLAAEAEDAMPAGADTRATGGPENGATE
ncbi:hypothetical protein NCF85_15370 (plasmid) [Qipengyuania citrea]|uniref:Secreted protein n=1 Tax=Qipengyuania citrea TaxID=225971 RepID=A0ABY4UBI6_9SPHN|nr:hypothetical protein [Qipengyuania citrea]USA63107.1 hypothetical protein NCF85_15370 [Qipengyuania citrea]